jgi:hypothetical protein
MATTRTEHPSLFSFEQNQSRPTKPVLTYPKSIEGTPYRWLSRPLTTARVNGRTYKAGGKVAILTCPVPGWTDVQVYQPDEEDWWDNLPPDLPIRAAVRGPSRHGDDLIGYALPLRNQPSELQRHINGLTAEQLPPPEPTPEPEHPWADAFYEGLRRREAKRQPAEPLVERRPRGVKDEELMRMIEQIAKTSGCRVCDTVNALLWEAVNGRLRGVS